MFKGKRAVFYIAAAILSTYFLIAGLVKAKGFFAPLTTAVILSLVVLPLSIWMEKFMKRPYAALINSLLLFGVSIGLMAIVSLQVRNFAEDWPQIQEQMTPKIEQLKTFALEHTPLESKDIDQTTTSDQIIGGDVKRTAASFVNGFSSFLANYLLTFVYVFFILNYREIFKNFLLRTMPDSKSDSIKNALSKSIKVAPQYLLGKLMLMGLLAVLYSIGLGISGVSNFILVSVIASILTLIPYVGNIMGFAMAVAFGFLSSGDTTVLIGITFTFAITQFVESYVLQPYIVGDRVDVHPFFIIISVIAGNMIWGIIGMILAIPVMGIIVVILLHIKQTKSIGMLLSKKKFEST